MSKSTYPMKYSKSILQLTFETVLEDSFKAHEKKMLAYIQANKNRYLGFARLIKPSLSDKDQVYARIAFAILSANSPFNSSCEALRYATDYAGKLTWSDVKHIMGMTSNKVSWVNDLHKTIKSDHKAYLKGKGESWQSYRSRLSDSVTGLGTCKASFAACLLYPLTADLACVDTWIQKVFLGNSGFKQLNLKTYELVEGKIRSYARRFNVGTFIAQWLIWDHARGTTNDHAIFPGSHK